LTRVKPNFDFPDKAVREIWVVCIFYMLWVYCNLCFK
jgi:hypothetical protein